MKELDLWKVAYIKLSRSGGSKTPSFDMITIDGTTLARLKALRDKVISGEYKVGVTHKGVYIPKANGKMRPLGIPPFDDRTVQEVVRTILQIIYEPIFSTHSHGFRPGRGCHTALRHIRAGSALFTWAIEGDILGFFDNIDRVLMELLGRKIKDPRFLALVHSLLKTIIREQGKLELVSSIGSPAAIISPLLSNILLHEFDLYMEKSIQEYNRGKYRRAKPEYSRAYHKYGVKAARQVGQSHSDPNYRRMHYVRYADDFVVTIIGPKKEAVEIKQKCAQFLERLKLTLSEEKTLITNPKSDPIRFLGYLIGKAAFKVNIYNRRYGDKIKVRRMTSGSILLKPDSEKVKKRLFDKGFCQRNGHPIANFKYLNNTQYGTIIQVGYILRGLANYYKLANNYRQMIIRLNYIIKFSIAKMFAAKYRMKSVAKIFAKGGYNLSRPIKSRRPKR